MSTTSKGEVDLLLSIKTSLSGMAEEELVTQAHSLHEGIEKDYLTLGGILSRLKENNWLHGHATFRIMAEQEFGIQWRKAEHLVTIYNRLIEESIPWSAVSGIGWTKLRAIARVVTLETLKSWVEVASKHNVILLEAIVSEAIKAQANGTPMGAAEVASTTQQVLDNAPISLKLSLHPDQYALISEAIDKIKEESGTEYYNVALQRLAEFYLQGGVDAQKAAPSQPAPTLAETSPEELLKSLLAQPSIQDLIVRQVVSSIPPERLLTIFSEVYPDVNLTVEM
jgi:hypothetical protein